VTVPFVCACGTCTPCARGDAQVCDAQTQPGFTHWGSYAEHVALHHADVNLVALPEAMSFDAAAGLGCRFATSFRAVVDQGRVQPGQWVAVFGCGGVGLSAIMIARALGARVIGVDVSEAAWRSRSRPEPRWCSTRATHTVAPPRRRARARCATMRDSPVAGLMSRWTRWGHAVPRAAHSKRCARTVAWCRWD
jgi:alcohol dehydrogenase